MFSCRHIVILNQILNQSSLKFKKKIFHLQILEMVNILLDEQIKYVNNGAGKKNELWWLLLLSYRLIIIV